MAFRPFALFPHCPITVFYPTYLFGYTVLWPEDETGRFTEESAGWRLFPVWSARFPQRLRAIQPERGGAGMVKRSREAHKWNVGSDSSV